MPADTLKRLARDAQALEQGRQARLAGLLERLERLDPEVVKQVIFAFNNNRAEASLWLADRPLVLGGLSPYDILAQGKRQDILNVLTRILHGIPS